MIERAVGPWVFWKLVVFTYTSVCLVSFDVYHRDWNRRKQSADDQGSFDNSVATDVHWPGRFLCVYRILRNGHYKVFEDSEQRAYCAEQFKETVSILAQLGLDDEVSIADFWTVLDRRHQLIN